jgi:hypothetical protein
MKSGQTTWMHQSVTPAQLLRMRSSARYSVSPLHMQAATTRHPQNRWRTKNKGAAPQTHHSHEQRSSKAPSTTPKSHTCSRSSPKLTASCPNCCTSTPPARGAAAAAVTMTATNVAHTPSLAASSRECAPPTSGATKISQQENQLHRVTIKDPRTDTMTH